MSESLYKVCKALWENSLKLKKSEGSFMAWYEHIGLTKDKVSELLKAINPSSGNPYSQTYIKTIHKQLTAIFSYAIKFHSLQENPCHKAGSIGKKHAEEMNIWTPEEFKLFIKTLKDHHASYA